MYLLLGEEDVRTEEALHVLLDELLPEADRAMNMDVVDAGSVPVQDILTRCETLPFFGARRVVVLNIRAPESWRTADQDAFVEYLERGPSATLVVLAPRLDERRRLSQVLRRTARVISCGPLEASELPTWIDAEARRAGKTITSDAARLLVELAGAGLRELGLEVGKLVAYAGDRPTITADDVRAIASHVATETTVFQLMDAVGHRRPDQAFRMLDALISLGEPPLRILYMLEDQIRLLARVQDLVDRRVRERAEIQSALGRRAWKYDDFRRQVAAFGRLDLARVLGMLLEADGAIKTGQLPGRLALETLIVQLSGA